MTLIQQQTYEASPKPQDILRESLKDWLALVEQERSENEGEPRAEDGWIVFFSPSGASAVVPLLRELDLLQPALGGSSLSSAGGLGRAYLKIAAIGPTTATALKEEYCVYVDAMSEGRGAAGLVAAITKPRTEVTPCQS